MCYTEKVIYTTLHGRRAWKWVLKKAKLEEEQSGENKSLRNIWIWRRMFM